MPTARDVPSEIHLPEEAEDRILFGERFISTIERIKRNDPGVTELLTRTNFTHPAWERLGTYIERNDHLRSLSLRAHLDDSKMSALFGGLTASDAMREVNVAHQVFGLNGIRCMTPFLRNCPNLKALRFEGNENIDAECFGVVLGSLDGGAIETLNFRSCKIDSLRALGQRALPQLRNLYLDYNCVTDIPPQALANCTRLVKLELRDNKIGSAGFCEIAALLRNEETTLEHLNVESTGMDDGDAAIIADSLRCNKKLDQICLWGNEFGLKGSAAFLKLLNDVSSIGSAANCNHTLSGVFYDPNSGCPKFKEVKTHIENALMANTRYRSFAGKYKIVTTVLNSEKRTELSRLQGIEHSSDHYLFRDVDPVLLPNVLELAGAHYEYRLNSAADTLDLTLMMRAPGGEEGGGGTTRIERQKRGRSELYRMMVVVAPDLLSLVDRKALLKEAMEKNEIRLAAIAAEQAVLNDANLRMRKQLMLLEGDEGRACQLSGAKRGRDTAP